MTTSIIFDDREHAVRAAFAQRIQGREDFQMESRRLEMGDVLIQHSAAESPMIVVERKQVTDLMSSLFDGRLAEQCSRMQQWKMNQTAGDVWTVIVVEGVASADAFRGTNADARYRHFVKTHLQLVLHAKPSDCHLVVRTGGVDETCVLLMTLHKTISAGVEGVHRMLSPSMPRKTQSDPFVRHLCCTQGVSTQRAMRIRERYQNTVDLAQSLATDAAGTLEELRSRIGSLKVAMRILEDLGHPCPEASLPKKRRTHMMSSSMGSSGSGS